LAAINQNWPNFAGFGIAYNVDAVGLTVPYWFATFMVGASGFALWYRVPYRFSLRALFIATTFLAVVLAMIAWLDRAWIGR
jgi:hypothetical protein